MGKINQLYTKETFKARAKEVWGDEYWEGTYDKMEYVNSKTKVTFICPIHGEYEQVPSSHLQHKHCPKCAKIIEAQKRRSNLEEWVKKAKKVWGDRFDYSKSVYKGATEPIEIICKKHGSFWQRACDHLSGYGCRECGYDSVRKKNSKPKSQSHIEKLVKKMIERNTKDGFKYISESERKFIKEFIEPLNIHYIPQFWFPEIRQLSDVYIPSLNLVIEFDGDFYHCNPAVYKDGPKYQCQIDKLKKDGIKNSYLESHNIPYLRIWEFDFKHNKDLVKQKLEESIKLAKEKLNK